MFGYTEPVTAATSTRDAYAASVRSFIAEQYSRQAAQREEYIKGLPADPEKYRGELIQMLGFPLDRKDLRAQPVQIRRRLLHEDDTVLLYRVTLTVLQSIEFTGLLFLHKDARQRPFIIAQHGGSGSPEVCSGLFEGGSGIYNDMTERIFRRGANVFAPQLLLWPDAYETPSFRRADRNLLDAQLKQLGGSVTALEIFCIIKALDIFCDEGIAKADRIGMIGHSYGGFYTLFTAAVDTRIKAALSCSFFNRRDQYPWIDWTWHASAGKFFDAEVSLLIHPRKLYIAVGDNDEMFQSTLAQQELERLQRLCKALYGDEAWPESCIFTGKHEFIPSDDYIEGVLRALEE